MTLPCLTCLQHTSLPWLNGTFVGRCNLGQNVYTCDSQKISFQIRHLPPPSCPSLDVWKKLVTNDPSHTGLSKCMECKELDTHTNGTIWCKLNKYTRTPSKKAGMKVALGIVEGLNLINNVGCVVSTECPHFKEKME